MVLSAITMLAGGGNTAEAAWPGRDGVAVFVAKRPAGEDGQVGVGLRTFVPGQSGSIRQLTSDPGDNAPQISPDGKSIVFERQLDELTAAGSARSAIFLVDVSGQGLRQLTQPGPAESDSDPTFDANGTHVVFARAGITDGGDLYSIGVGGGSLRHLTKGAGADSSPAVSPTGRQIAFDRLVYRSSDRSAEQHVFSMRPDGSGVRDLTARWRATALGWPDFSPDGRRVAFSVGMAFDSELFVMRADGSRPRSITDCREHRKGFIEPTFSPSGGSLLAAAVDQYGSNLIRLALSSGCPRSSSLAGVGDGDAPAWGPAAR